MSDISNMAEKLKVDRPKSHLETYQSEITEYIASKLKNYNVPIRLRGWDYIKSLMCVCPICGQKPFLGNTVSLNQWQCACMNACCPNMNVSTHENPFMAIHAWNTRANEKGGSE